jgi:hypothetical protein
MYRHGVELMLKAIVLESLAGEDGQVNEADARNVILDSHSLTALLRRTERLGLVWPTGLQRRDLEKLITELDRADPKAITFRYPVTTRLDPTLLEFDLGNFVGLMET